MLKLTLVTSTLLYVVGSISISTMPEEIPQLKRVDYDNYVFVTEWPGTVCKYKNCTDDFAKKSHFNLHGLWPNYWDGSWPQYCTKTPLNYQSLPQSLKDLLNEYWSGLFNSEEHFLSHEWDRHGTCWNPTYGNFLRVPTHLIPILTAARARTFQDPADFLQLVATLIKDSYEFSAIFKEGGVVPSSTKTYSLAAIRKLISDKLGVPETGFAVKCYQGKFLDSVWLCLNRDYQPVGDCENFLQGNCQEQVHYPLDPVHPIVE